MVLSGVIYHGEEQSHCGHYTSGVKVGNTWFLISDTKMLRQQELLCSSKDIVCYMAIFETITNFLKAPTNSLNGTDEVCPTSELIRETTETMILTISSLGTRKTESQNDYCSGTIENRFKQSEISSEEKVQIHIS